MSNIYTVTKEDAVELNLLVQKFLRAKFGKEAEYTCQFNEDHIHLWVKLPLTNTTEEG